VKSITYPLVFVLLYLFLPGYAAVKPDATKPQTTVFIDKENRLHYEGYLDKDSNDLLLALYEKATVKPETLVISSGGGDVLLGLDLGEWIYDNGLNVVIDRMCASSCANYIFTAANRKGLKKDSVLFWHGSSWQKDVDELYRQGNEFVVALRKREVSFLKKIEVDHRIATYGLSRYSFWSYVAAFITTVPIEGFDFSIEDMAKFGVTNVYLVDDHWNWREHTNCCNVKRVEVDDNEI